MTAVPRLVGPRVSGAHSAALSVPVVIFTNSWMMGGMEVHIDALARGLVARGVRVAMICPTDEAVEPLRDGLAACGVDVHAVPGGARGPLGLRRRLRAVRGIVRHYPDCVVHLHLTGSDGGTLPVAAARLAGAAAVVRTEHLPPDARPSLRRRLLTRARDRALDRIICVSRANLNAYLAELGRDRRKCVSIPNGVDLTRFDLAEATGARIRDVIGAPEGSVVVGMVGRLAERRKGAEEFIAMAQALAAAHDEYHFIIVGEGPRRAGLESQSAGLVGFPGAPPHAEVADWYAAMDIVVSPSLAEGGPVTVLEAMAMARPVVATHVGMVPEVIADGVNGRIVAPGDVAALARTVDDLRADPPAAREMGRRARETIEDGYSSDVMVERVAALYAELIPAGRPATCSTLS